MDKTLCKCMFVLPFGDKVQWPWQWQCPPSHCKYQKLCSAAAGNQSITTFTKLNWVCGLSKVLKHPRRASFHQQSSHLREAHLHPVVCLGVDVDGSAEMVHGPAVRLVNGDLLLVSVAHRKPKNTRMWAQVQNYFESLAQFQSFLRSLAHFFHQ